MSTSPPAKASAGRSAAQATHDTVQSRVRIDIPPADQIAHPSDRIATEVADHAVHVLVRRACATTRPQRPVIARLDTREQGHPTSHTAVLPLPEPARSIRAGIGGRS